MSYHPETVSDKWYAFERPRRAESNHAKISC